MAELLAVDVAKDGKEVLQPHRGLQVVTPVHPEETAGVAPGQTAGGRGDQRGLADAAHAGQDDQFLAPQQRPGQLHQVSLAPAGWLCWLLGRLEVAVESTGGGEGGHAHQRFPLHARPGPAAGLTQQHVSPRPQEHRQVGEGGATEGARSQRAQRGDRGVQRLAGGAAGPQVGVEGGQERHDCSHGDALVHRQHGRHARRKEHVGQAGIAHRRLAGGEDGQPGAWGRAWLFPRRAEQGGHLCRGQEVHQPVLPLEGQVAGGGLGQRRLAARADGGVGLALLLRDKMAAVGAGPGPDTVTVEVYHVPVLGQPAAQRLDGGRAGEGQFDGGLHLGQFVGQRPGVTDLGQGGLVEGAGDDGEDAESGRLGFQGSRWRGLLDDDVAPAGVHWAGHVADVGGVLFGHWLLLQGSLAQYSTGGEVWQKNPSPLRGGESLAPPPSQGRRLGVGGSVSSSPRRVGVSYSPFPPREGGRGVRFRGGTRR